MDTTGSHVVVFDLLLNQSDDLINHLDVDVFSYYSFIRPPHFLNGIVAVGENITE